MRFVLSAVFLLIVFLGVTVLTLEHDAELEPVLYTYMTRNFFEDTSAKNAVAAILLNYRMYDTIFEALILLTAIVGMMQFLPGPSDLADSPRKADLRKENEEKAIDE